MQSYGTGIRELAYQQIKNGRENSMMYMYNELNASAILYMPHHGICEKMEEPQGSRLCAEFALLCLARNL